ncbi:hypothetical protein KAS41_02285 [Candidatus Parcubacteria bacterium]|nr:hypothetical protein [Candidatus Parcubacteria bacterium]
MMENKIDWKPLCKWGIIFGAIAAFISWLTIFLNNTTNFDECQFIQYILLIFNVPTLILITIIFGPLGDRFPILFHDPQGVYETIAKIIWHICAFITYFFIGVLVKIIYNNKNKNKKIENHIAKKQKKGGE